MTEHRKPNKHINRSKKNIQTEKGERNACILIWFERKRNCSSVEHTGLSDEQIEGKRAGKKLKRKIWKDAAAAMAADFLWPMLSSDFVTWEHLDHSDDFMPNSFLARFFFFHLLSNHFYAMHSACVSFSTRFYESRWLATCIALVGATAHGVCRNTNSSVCLHSISKKLIIGSTKFGDDLATIESLFDVVTVD